MFLFRQQRAYQAGKSTDLCAKQNGLKDIKFKVHYLIKQFLGGFNCYAIMVCRRIDYFCIALSDEKFKTVRGST